MLKPRSFLVCNENMEIWATESNVGMWMRYKLSVD